MPDLSIHPSNVARIERECAEARQRARYGIMKTLETSIEFWTKESALAEARSTQAYDEEQARLHTLMLAALEADRVAGEAG